MKKQFKVQLFSYENYQAEQVVLMAARNNAGLGSVDIKGLKSIGEGLRKQFPELAMQPTNFELIDNKLCIDALYVDGWKEVAIIEEVEVFEMPAINDLNGLFTSTKEEKEEVI